MRLAGMVFGLEMVFNLGRSMCEADEYGRRSFLALPGFAIMATGSLGWLAGRALKAAVSRQREFLADARAVQFTRSKDGLGGVLRKVAGEAGGRRRIRAARRVSLHPAVQHMLLVSAGHPGPLVCQPSAAGRAHPPHLRPADGGAVCAARRSCRDPARRPVLTARCGEPHALCALAATDQRAPRRGWSNRGRTVRVRTGLTLACHKAGPDRTDARPPNPAPSAQVPLWRQLQGAASVLMAVRDGQSMTPALDDVDAALRPGVQALAFHALRWLGRAEALRQQLAKRPPPPKPTRCCAWRWRWLLAKSDAPYTAHTLVDQAVEAAKRSEATQHQASFINGCLRRFLREQRELMALTEKSPQAVWNHPQWWIDRVRKDHPAQWQAILQANNSQAPLILRVNARKTTQARLPACAGSWPVSKPSRSASTA